MKIYISSTFEDLKDYRAKVYQQLRKLRHDVISMEDYVAGDQRPLSKCLQDVREADIYVGLFAWRYGYVPTARNPAKRSITELEYREALKAKKQCLIFLLDKNAQWSPQYMDIQSGKKDAGKNINSLRAELAERHMVSFFSAPDQLVNDVLTAVYRVQFDASMRPAPETAAEPKKTAKVNVAKAEKKEYAREGYPRLWKPGIALRVSFLDGSERQQSFVRRFAPIWSAYANIRFEFGNDADAELRVSFKQDGSWAYVGTDALTIPANMPTVSFGWLTDGTEDTQADYVILREFGYVLGLLPELQNPSENVPWNKAAVYRYFGGSPNNWSKATIDQNFFTHWAENSFPVKKPFDSKSIMANPIESALTDGKFNIGWNTQLSTGDKEFIGRLYPFTFENVSKKEARPKNEQ